MLICVVFFSGTFPEQPMNSVDYHEVNGVLTCLTSMDSEGVVRVIVDGKELAVCDKQTKKWNIANVGTFEHFRTVIR